MQELGVVHRAVRRPDPAVVQELGRYGVATIHEAMGRTGLMGPRIRPAYPGARLCGPALTILLQPGDNWMLHVAVEVIEPGDVLVAACLQDSEHGFVGELLATSFRAHGAVGLVLDGGARDVTELAAMDFPVFSRAIHAEGTVKERLGSINVPITCAGRLVNPGDVVVGDADGVVVIPAGSAAQVAAAAGAREAKELDIRGRLARGEVGLDIYGMREGLERAGLRYVE